MYKANRRDTYTQSPAYIRRTGGAAGRDEEKTSLENGAVVSNAWKFFAGHLRFPIVLFLFTVT